MRYISVEDAHSKVKKGQMMILDIREPYEFEICSIKSLQIPMAEVVSRISEVPTDKAIAVMCRSGKRAEAMTNILTTEHDLTNSYVLEGGILAWIEKFDTHLESY
jgi:adenylyltransferase/sulfurtransferase